MLSKQQKSALGVCKKYANNDEIEIHVVIYPYRNLGRNGGNGYPINAELYYNDDAPGYDGVKITHSFCSERYTAFDKAKEIARYLVDVVGITKAQVKIKSRIGNES